MDATEAERKMMLRYIWHNLIALDQMRNAFSGGDPDETISGTASKIAGYCFGERLREFWARWAADMRKSQRSMMKVKETFSFSFLADCGIVWTRYGASLPARQLS